MDSMNVEIGLEYRTLDDVVNGLTSLERQFKAACDRGGVFVTVYGMMSREMKRRIETRSFSITNGWLGKPR
jgi:hypothetical protein